MNRFLPVLVFLVTALIGVGMTMIVWRSENSAERSRFVLVADDAVDRLTSRLNEHAALLFTTKTLFETNGNEIRRSQFKIFVDKLLEDGRYRGIQGMGLAVLQAAGDEALAEKILLGNYGETFEIRPQTTQEFRTPIVLLEPDDERNRNALGFDMFSEANRRNAMLEAIRTGEAIASGPVELVQEIVGEKQAGFLLYLPVEKQQARAIGSSRINDDYFGFIYAPFRAGDLHQAALGEGDSLPMALKTVDVTGGAQVPLYESRNFEEISGSSKYEVKKEVEFAGRTWEMTFHETPGFVSGLSRIGTFLLGSLSLLFAAALAASTRAQIKRVESSRALAEQRTAYANRNELMLQEMKHRIKNHIGRIQAISRQTARSSTTLDEYNSAFSSRLQALANAQDVLTRSSWQRAELADLVRNELEQVFGEKLESAGFSGPDVTLNEKQAQAMSLTLHELATNALKYGGVTGEQSNLSVLWEVRREGKQRVLSISWIEHSPHPAEMPEKTGFGTKLIDANIRGELGGTIKRDYTDNGLSVEMSFPI